MSLTIWIALITALSTLIGTLGSQFLAHRLQDRQWQQQRQDRRDDERLQRYASLLLLLGDWQNALEATQKNREEYIEERGDPDPEDESPRAFDGYRAAARQHLAVINLITRSSKVRSRAREAINAGESCYLDMMRGTLSSSRFGECISALNDAMRDDLKLDFHASLAGPGTDSPDGNNNRTGITD